MITDLPTTTVTTAGGTVEFRFDRRTGPPVLICHGGHMRAGLAVGEDDFGAADCSMLVPSRPGYGHTPLSTGPNPTGFADVARDLCRHLGIDRLAAVVGISGGGPTAVAVAARHPDLAARLVLISAVGPLPYPSRGVKAGAHVVFAPRVEAATWAALRTVLRHAPDLGLRMMLGGLSTNPAPEVLARLTPEDRRTLLGLFTRMRSGAGFVNDIAPTADLTDAVTQPTLVIATRTDAGVPFRHAEALVGAIRGSRLIESRADTHFVWFSPDWPAIAEEIQAFLADAPAR